MYINDFLCSLDYLKKENIPNYDIFPKNLVIYYGYVYKEELKGEKFRHTDKKYLYFSPIENIRKISYIGIDKYNDYIDILNNEDIKIKKGSRYKDIELAFFEGIWLFDLLAKVDNNLLDINIPAGADLVYSIVKNDLFDNITSTLKHFDGNPIRQDIFLAQFNYFVKKYIKAKINRDINEKTKLCNYSHFDFRLRNNLIEYIKCKNSHDNTYYKARKNSNDCLFEDFIQQVKILKNKPLI